MNDIEKYLHAGLKSFLHDPADSSFQRGYLSALLTIAQELAPDVYNKFDLLEDQCNRKGVQ